MPVEKNFDGLSHFCVAVNMKGKGRVGMKDFELLRVLGTGGETLSLLAILKLCACMHTYIIGTIYLSTVHACPCTRPGRCKYRALV